MKHTRSMMIRLAACAAMAAAGCGRSGVATLPVAPPPPTSASQGQGDFGTLAKVCGPGDARGTTAQGVTDTAIDVGTMSDPGAPQAPGLNQELFDTAKAFTKWCNDAGGIAGRKLVLHLRDAKLFEVAARTLEACGQDFAEVGGGTAFDESGVKQRVDCGLPEVPAYDVSPQAAEAPLKVQANATPVQEQTVAVFRGVQHAFPGVTRMGYLVGNLSSIIPVGKRSRDAIEQIGFHTVYDETYQVTGIDNPQSYVQRMRDRRVEVLTLVGEPGGLVAIEKAMQSVGWYPRAIVQTGNFYDKKVIQNGGDALRNTWVGTAFYPFELARSNPATAQYLAIMAQEVPGGKIAALGLSGWDAWLLFATAARDCGSTLTRACLLERAAAHNDWTGGGLKAPMSTDTVHPHANQCTVILKADQTGFLLDPSLLPPNQSIFNCSPANVIALKGDYRPKT